MSRWRSSMVLLGISVLAMIVGFLRVLTEPTPQPPGSTYSAQPDGALALYTWLQAAGAQPLRVTQPDQATGMLFILEPPTPVDRATIEAAADGGQTVVLAGSGIGWFTSARALGVGVQPTAPTPTVSSLDGLTVRFSGRNELRADAFAQPLLLRTDGTWAALRMPYRAGALVVVASSEPFSNTGLADPDTARFVFRTFVQPAQNQPVAFEESRPAPGASTPGTSLNQLLFATAPGWAIVYVALLTFAFLFLTGRRLGPAIAVPPAEASQRTMYEHVQMLANLYRRAGQLDAARAAFRQHYAQRLGRTRRPDLFAESLARLESTHSEPDLIHAVNALDDAV